MSHLFISIIDGDVKERLDQIKKEAASRGIEFRGDMQKGEFEGRITLGTLYGTYEVLGNTITVDIVSKPHLVSWSMVMAQMRGLVEKGNRK